jgi:hypothetical protein
MTKDKVNDDKTISNYKVRVLVFNATFKFIWAISQQSVLLVEETGVLWENQTPAASRWQTWSHIVVLSATRHEQGSNS